MGGPDRRTRGVTRQRGQIYRQPSGLWAIRYRDAHGNRPQLTGYRTKAEAREVLEELLRQGRLRAAEPAPGAPRGPPPAGPEAHQGGAAAPGVLRRHKQAGPP